MHTHSALTAEHDLTASSPNAFIARLVAAPPQQRTPPRAARASRTRRPGSCARSPAADRPPRMSELAAGLGIVPRSATTTVEALEDGRLRRAAARSRRPPLGARGAHPRRRARGDAHPVRPLRRRRRSVRRPRRRGARHPPRAPRSRRRSRHGGGPMMRGGGRDGNGPPVVASRPERPHPGAHARNPQARAQARARLQADARAVPLPRHRRRGARHAQPADPARHHQQRHRWPRQSPRHRARPARRRDRDARHARHAHPALRVGAHRRVVDLRPSPSRVRTRAADADRVLHPHADGRARQPAEQRHHRRAAGVHEHTRLRREQHHHRHHRDRRDAGALVADHASRRSRSFPSS